MLTIRASSSSGTGSKEDGEINYLMFESSMPEAGWKVRVLSNLAPVRKQVLWASVLTGSIFASLVLIALFLLERRKAEEIHQKLQEIQAQLIDELEKELQIAHDMQMGLMPTESPQIEGFDVAGRCLPANHVGGDFFKYYLLSQNRLAGVLADVTGHGMEAAVPLLVFNGTLESQIELGGTIEELFGRLNNSLHRILDRRTFICFTMAELNPATRMFRMSNCGCPYPFHYQAATQEVIELQMAAYPLGIRADATYEAIEVQLEPGDRVVFCSDGIAEAANPQEELFTFEQTAEVIRQGCQQGLAAEALLEHLFGQVKAFTGEAEQGDDMTVVVLQVTEPEAVS